MSGSSKAPDRVPDLPMRCENGNAAEGDSESEVKSWKEARRPPPPPLVPKKEALRPPGWASAPSARPRPDAAPRPPSSSDAILADRSEGDLDHKFKAGRHRNQTARH